jgi:hypothetical protein
MQDHNWVVGADAWCVCYTELDRFSVRRGSVASVGKKLGQFRSVDGKFVVSFRLSDGCLPSSYLNNIETKIVSDLSEWMYRAGKSVAIDKIKKAVACPSALQGLSVEEVYGLAKMVGAYYPRMDSSAMEADHCVWTIGTDGGVLIPD